jgi:hypothetical protein
MLDTRTYTTTDGWEYLISGGKLYRRPIGNFGSFEKVPKTDEFSTNRTN